MRLHTFYNIVACAAMCILSLSCGVRHSATQQTHAASAPPPVPPVTETTNGQNTAQRLQYFYLEAVKQHNMGNFAEAYELLRHCKDISPTSAEVYHSLSLYDGTLNSTEMAYADIRRAAELSPGNSTYQERVALLNVQTGDYMSAAKAYEKLYADNPDRTEILSILLQLYGKQKDFSKMLRTIKRMEDADGESEQTVLSKMHVYAQQGKKKEEYATLKNFVDRYPNDLSYRVMMSNWLLQNGKKEQAFSTLQGVLKEEPNNISAQLSLIDYYNAEGSDSLANSLRDRLLLNPQTPTDTKISMLRQAVAKSEQAGGTDSVKVVNLFKEILDTPQKTADIAEMYVSYLNLKNAPQDTIVAAINRVLDIQPDNKGARIELIRLLWGEENVEKIKDICRQAIEYNPDEIVFYYFLGMGLIQTDDDDQAIEVLRKGVAQAVPSSEPTVVADMYAATGDLLYRKGLVKECVAAFDSCLQWQEDNVECLNNYAYYLSEMKDGDLTKAEQMSYKTIKAEPTNSTYLDTYAWILFKEKRYEEAQIYIDQAVANDSTVSSVIIEHAGDIHAVNGDSDKAVEYWKKAIEAGGDTPLLEQKIARRRYIEDDNEDK